MFSPRLTQGRCVWPWCGCQDRKCALGSLLQRYQPKKGKLRKNDVLWSCRFGYCRPWSLGSISLDLWWSQAAWQDTMDVDKKSCLPHEDLSREKRREEGRQERSRGWGRGRGGGRDRTENTEVTVFYKPLHFYKSRRFVHSIKNTAVGWWGWRGG